MFPTIEWAQFRAQSLLNPLIRVNRRLDTYPRALERADRARKSAQHGDPWSAQAVRAYI